MAEVFPTPGDLWGRVQIAPSRRQEERGGRHEAPWRRGVQHERNLRPIWDLSLMETVRAHLRAHRIGAYSGHATAT